MGQPFVVVDAFTDRAFAGNPAAVCVLAEPADERWMRSVAAEMNLSETAFLHPEDGGYRLRWFTPTVEVNLCGHATLASAHVLWESERLPRDAEIRFATHSGLLTAKRDGAFINLDLSGNAGGPLPAPAGIGRRARGRTTLGGQARS
jgi:PhzF family phenazine biosynthesis protein